MVAKMDEEEEYIKIVPSKTKRNEMGSNVEAISISLPAETMNMIRKWAAAHNVSFSRAVHTLCWHGYHAEMGDFKPYEQRDR